MVVALAATYGCSGGLSCGSGSGCSNDYAYPQTTALVPNGTEFVDEGVRMRMTQDALDFIVANIRPILAQTLGSDPSGDNILISRTDRVDLGDNISLGRGAVETHPYEIYINANDLSSTLQIEFVGDDPNEPEGIRMRSSNVRIGADVRAFADFAGTVACDVFGTNGSLGATRQSPYVTTLSLDATIRPRVGSEDECDNNAPECLKIDVTVEDVQIGNFDSGVFEIQNPGDCPGDGLSNPDGLGPCSEDCSDPSCCFVSDDVECSLECGFANFAASFFAELASLFQGLIEDALPGILEGAIRNALDDFDGSPLAASGRLALGDFAPGVIPSGALDLGFAVGPTTGAFDVNDPADTAGAQGMDLIFKSGFEAAPPLVDDTPVPHPCVRPIAGNDFGDLYGGFRFEAPDAEPLTGVFNGNVYALGASLAEGSINQMLFATYNTGALCIEASTDSIHALTGGGFQFSAGLLDLLTEGKMRQYTSASAPAIVALAPSQPPVIAYGEGTDVEGHLVIDWPAVEVSFYVLMNERFARVFAVSTDISMQLTVFNDPATGKLRIAVIDGPNIENFVENYNELLPGIAFTEVLESLIGVAFDAALGDGLEFDFDVGTILADALNAPIFIEFLGIETIPPDDRNFLNVYLGLTSTPPPNAYTARPRIALDAVPGVVRESEAQRVRYLPTGEVRIRDEEIGEREYFAKIDFGAWRGPIRAEDGVITIRDPKLRLVGQHVITVRAREIGYPNSLESDGAQIAVWVDPEAPKVSLSLVEDELVVSATDIGARVEELTYQWRANDGDWGDYLDAPRRSVDDFAGARRVAVRAIDPAGNISRSVSIDLITAKKRVDEEAAGRFIGGCAQASDTAWLGALLLTGLALLRRRR